MITIAVTATHWTGWQKYGLLPCPRCGWQNLKPTKNHNVGHGKKTGKYKIYTVKNKEGRILKLVFKCQNCNYETEVTTHEPSTGIQYNIQVRQTTPVCDLNDLIERSRR